MKGSGTTTPAAPRLRAPGRRDPLTAEGPGSKLRGMKRLSTHAVASLLVLAVTAQVAPALAHPQSAQPQCGDEKKGDDTKDDKKDDKSGDTKPKAPSLL